MTSPAVHDPNTPTVKLDGKEWPIPELVPRQLRHMRSALLEMNAKLGQEDGDKAVSAFGLLSDEDYDRLVLKPIYWALTRAHPALTEEEFLDFKSTDGERVTAWYIVRTQSGLFVFAQPEGEDGATQAGEAQAA